MPALFSALCSRRALVQAAAATLGVAALSQARAQGPASSAPVYDISHWTGALDGFRLVDATGKTWRPDDFQGRAVLLNFWASWCEPCRAEMPSLQQVAALNGASKLLVLAINFKEAPAIAIRFAERAGISLPLLFDVDGQAAKAWGVRIFPTTLTIDRRGRPRHRVRGELDWAGPAAGRLIASLL